MRGTRRGAWEVEALYKRLQRRVSTMTLTDDEATDVLSFASEHLWRMIQTTTPYSITTSQLLNVSLLVGYRGLLRSVSTSVLATEVYRDDVDPRSGEYQGTRREAAAVVVELLEAVATKPSELELIRWAKDGGTMTQLSCYKGRTRQAVSITKCKLEHKLRKALKRSPVRKPRYFLSEGDDDVNEGE